MEPDPHTAEPSWLRRGPVEGPVQHPLAAHLAECHYLEVFKAKIQALQLPENSFKNKYQRLRMVFVNPIGRKIDFFLETVLLI